MNRDQKKLAMKCTLKTLCDRAQFIDTKAIETEAEWNMARSILWAICLSEGWTEASGFLDEYVRPHGSKTWIAHTPSGEIMGGLVLVEDRFPIKNLPDAWPGLKIEGSRPVEIAFLGISRRYRLQGAEVAIISTIARYALERDLSDFYAILDDRRSNLFRSLGFRFHEISQDMGGGRHIFWGEECYPAKLNRLEGEKFLKEHNPWMWELIVNGDRIKGNI